MRALAHAAAVLSIIAPLLSGCGNGGDGPGDLASLRQSVETGKYAEAVITAKVAIDNHPDGAEERYLLALAYLGLNDSNAALIEIDKAGAAGFDKLKVLSARCRALAANQSWTRVVSDCAVQADGGELDKDAMAEVALAHARIGQADRSESLLQKVLLGDPKHVPSRLASARLAAGKGQFKDAIIATNQVLAEHPNNVEALVLAAQVRLHGGNDLKSAEPLLVKAMEIDPRHHTAFSLLTAAKISSGDFDGATKLIEAARKRGLRSGQANYFAAQVALGKGDIQKARQESQTLLTIAPDDKQALMLSGVVAMAAAQPGQAITLFAKLVAGDPKNAVARRMLARAQLSIGQSAKALETLSPLLAAQVVQADTLSLAALAYANLGQPSKAIDLFSKANQARPSDSATAMRLAALRAQQGDDAALQHLEQLTKSSSKSEAHLALITAALQRRNMPMALEATHALDKLDPKSPVPKDLEARIQMGSGKLKEARASFLEAITRDGAYFASVAGLNEIDRQEGKPEQAVERIKAWSEKYPKHALGRLAEVELQSLSGANADTTMAALERAVADIPDDAMLRAVLISQLSSQKKFQRALEAADAAVNSIPNNPRLLALQGDALILTGDTARATNVFRKLEALSPADPTPHFRMAELHLNAGAPDQAEKSLKRAVEVSPSSPEALKRLYKFYADRKSWEQVMVVSHDLQKRFPQTALGLLAEADAWMAKGRRKDAIAALTKADGLTDGGDLGWRLFVATGQDAGAAAADKLAEDWLRKHPGDVGFMFQLGTHYFSQGNQESAQRSYERLVAAAPQHALALNNLAWLRMRKGDLVGAQKASAAAVQASPTAATYWDTHAAVLTAASKFEEGIAAARKATAIEKNNPMFQLTLVQSLLAAGKRQEASEALQPLIALGKGFPKSDEVARLARIAKT